VIGLRLGLGPGAGSTGVVRNFGRAANEQLQCLFKPSAFSGGEWFARSLMLPGLRPASFFGSQLSNLIEHRKSNLEMRFRFLPTLPNPSRARHGKPRRAEFQNSQAKVRPVIERGPLLADPPIAFKHQIYLITPPQTLWRVGVLCAAVVIIGPHGAGTA
jgi:hypothetical protein